jgi:methyl-accepting chemotaxis protein
VNAAVEAARAGEEGRGFAVVAAEVRSLAQRSAEAAKQIKALIQDSLRKVERGTDLVNKSGETLHGIVSSVKRVTDIVGEIAAAAGEQSTGIEQVNTAMTQMDQVTQSTRRRPRSCPRRRNPFPTRPTTSWSWSRSSR